MFYIGLRIAALIVTSKEIKKNISYHNFYCTANHVLIKLHVHSLSCSGIQLCHPEKTVLVTF